MSVFTNPASRSAEQAREYTAAVLDLLGSRDPMEVLRSSVSNLEAVCNGMTDEQIRQPEAPGKWSVRHALQHLADSELMWGCRLRMVLTHDCPQLTGYDQDLWAERLRYDAVLPEQAIEDFTHLRNANLRLLSRMSRENLKRVGIHAERGEESVEYMIRLYAGHDLLHLQQIDRIKNTLMTGNV